ncbi:MAG: hypothetical protein WC678_04530 [Parcubacteria group bacterium]|jgi:chemotaxis protein histidine kinase CheA
MEKPKTTVIKQPTDPHKERLGQVLQNQELSKEEMAAQAARILLEKGDAIKEAVEAEKSQFESEANEAKNLIETLRKQIEDEAEQAIAEIHKQSSERQAKLEAKRGVLDQRSRELNESQGLLEKWKNANALHDRWKNGTVAQWLIAHYLISKWRDNYKEKYTAKKKGYDEKWGKE